MNCCRFAHARLRAATADAHAALERQTNVLERLSTPALRAQMLQGYLDLYAGAATPLATWFASERLSDAIHQRVIRVHRDLASLGVRPGHEAERAAGHFELTSRAEAFGFLYVIEGSALGGSVILQALRKRGADVSSLTFLDAGTAMPRDAWSRLLDALEAEVGLDEARLAEAISGALEGFRYAQRCLCEEEEGA